MWGIIKRMGGDRRQWEYPVMVFEEETAGERRKLRLWPNNLQVFIVKKIHRKEKINNFESTFL